MNPQEKKSILIDTSTVLCKRLHVEEAWDDEQMSLKKSNNSENYLLNKGLIEGTVPLVVLINYNEIKFNLQTQQINIERLLGLPNCFEIFVPKTSEANRILSFSKTGV
jgi:hypothetical protein